MPADPLPEYEPVGCFKDKTGDRAMSDNYANFRFFIDWHNLNSTIRQCALVARDKGYKYFAVQFYGECWSSPDAAETYNRHGPQKDLKKCQAGVGALFTNYVYRFKQVSLLQLLLTYWAQSIILNPGWNGSIGRFPIDILGSGKVRLCRKERKYFFSQPSAFGHHDIICLSVERAWCNPTYLEEK